MSIFALADLHLSLDTDKSMEIFAGWENYTERIKANWKRLVKENDTVVLAGDISWSTDIKDAFRDFAFLEALPGQKIIIKGNHDYWWTTLKKMQEFLKENNFSSIKILHNDCIAIDRWGVCGTRGWVYDGTKEQDEKVIARECGRLKTSIEKALANNLEPIVFLHYPPVYNGYVCEPIVEVLRQYKIDKIFYGHIHGAGRNQAPNEYENIKMRIISCDCVDFTPIFVV